ncbi:MAG: hypothetical protein AAFQ89_02925 [Cyanobacteria bacterium J06626_18]
MGDLVRLEQPFIPAIAAYQVYHFGIVVGVVSECSNTDVLVHLFDPASSDIYTDESGLKAVYSFQLNEVEPVGDRSQHNE